MSKTILEAKQIVKRFPGTIAVDHVDFALKKAEIRALLGENGAGKSTLIKIITGVYRKDAGTILLDGREISRSNISIQNRIAFVPQELNLFTHLTVAENIFIPIQQRHGKLGRYIVNHKRLNRNAREILEKLEVDIDPETVVGRLGTAHLQMVQIARAIGQHFEILILDEPTSSISYTETENLFKILRTFKSEGKSLIYITHKLSEVFQLADSVTILRDGTHVGSYPINELDRASIVNRMAGEQLSELDLEKDQKETRQKVLLEVKALSGPGFSHIDFALHEGEILGLAGLVGAKRTEIAKAIFGAFPKKSGRIFLGGKEVKIGKPTDAFRQGLVYMPEDRKHLGIFGQLGLKENLTLPLMKKFSLFGIISKNRQDRFARETVSRFNIRASSLNQRMAFLSGGNQQKVIIARSIAVNPKVLIFDEPTVGIDVKAKSEIFTQLNELAKRGLGIIVISSEIDELLKIADRIIVIYDGQVNGEFQAHMSYREDVLRSALGL